MPHLPDDNDRLRGIGPALPLDPFEDTVPMVDPAAREDAAKLEPWHVRAVLARFLEERPEAEYIAPLPGGVYPDMAREEYPPAHLETPVQGDRPGWPALRALLGGWRPDTVAVLVGHTGRGKSSLAVQVAEEAARSGAPVLYASLEMDAEELLARMLAMRGRDGVRWAAVKRRRYPLEALRAAGERLVCASPYLYLWAPRGGERNVLELDAMARRVSVAAGGRPPLVVLDYVQRLADPSTDERRGAVSALSGQLRDLSRPSTGWPGCAVLALSSVGRGAYERFTTCKALSEAVDLEGTGKESGELEYDAPIVLALTSDTKDGAPIREALLRVVKNREGSTGDVSMTFHAARGLFREGAPPPPRDTSKRKTSASAQSTDLDY